MYGLCAKYGIETDGKTPRELWREIHEAEERKKTEAARRMGVEREDDPDEEYSFGWAFSKAEIPTSTDAVETVDFGKVKKPETASIVLETIDKVAAKYKLNKIKSVKVEALPIGTYGKTNGNELILSERLLKFPGAAYHMSVTGWQKNNELRRKELESGELQKRYTNASVLQAKMQVKFTRNDVIYPGKEIETTVLHEMGHVVAAQLFGQLNDNRYLKNSIQFEEAQRKATIVKQAYIDAINDGTIYELSYYASKNEKEFFAECFVIKHIGKERLPEKINKMMEEVMK